MWWREIAQLREQLMAAVARASAAEASLEAQRELSDERRRNWETALAERARAMDAASAERAENRRQERHLTSMWLRNQKSFPLPLTADEKVEAKEQAEEAKKIPPKLSDVEKAMMEANRRDAAASGVSAEDADNDFMKNRHKLVMD